MFVAIGVAELHIPGSRSLKEKRKVLKSAVDRLHHRLRISIAEVEHHDLRQRSGLGWAVVATTHSHAEEISDKIRRYFENLTTAELVAWDVDILEGEA